MSIEACRRRKTCRLCNSSKLVLVLELKPTPLANAFVKNPSESEHQNCFPLDVFFCENCEHVQLLDVVDPSILFKNYVYVSGTSPSFIKHFEEYASSIIDRFSLNLESVVIDIGSNDGTLLSAFQKKGMRGLGVDPALEIAARATNSGIETIPDFFSVDLAKMILADRGKVAVVTANNVFAHADDLRGIVDGIRILLAPNGVFVFEVSYLADIIKNNLFDTIYHEHLAYHSVKPLKKFFLEKGLQLFSVEKVASHGGSIRGMVGLANGQHISDGSVDSIIAEEEIAGLNRSETYRGFGKNIDVLGQQLKTIIGNIKEEGKTLAGFGAPAKATTLMYNFGIGQKEIDFIVDDSPLKQGLYSPGTHIPVLPTNAIYELRPDYVIILAWNFAKQIIEKHSSFLDGGGCFIVPLPEIKIFKMSVQP